ncbi:DUF3488 and transglutaminase-like domain-containing protein [Actinomadura gamaensis]|uniref:DUF3488 and transglutaminase-like domain-containing protein n=1 Tax=Actinomadura gamaensis TaxID=1763541 RepID=A0ABV9U0J2_9ACTN
MLTLAVAAGLAAVAGLAFHRVFGFGPVVPVVAVAAVGPCVLSGLLARWPLWTSLIATVVGWFGAVAATALRPALGDGTFAQALRDGVLSSWKTILTTLLPVPAKPETLVLVSLLTWLAGFGAAELALRTRWRAVPALPPLAVFGVALLLGVDGPGSNLPLVAAAAVLIGVLVLTRGKAGRAALLGIPAAVALGAVAYLAGQVVPVSPDPYDPREQVQAPPPQQRDSVSPLDRVGGWLLSPDQPMFAVAAPREEDQRLAVLDRFDGVTWTSSGRFVPTGSRVPPGPGDTGRHRRVDETITVRKLPGVWVPAADRPRTVRGLGVVVDPASGALAAAQPLRDGQRFTVESSVKEWRNTDLTGLRVADDDEARADTQLPWGPGATKPPVQLAEFRRFAQAAVGDATEPLDRAFRLADYLKGFARYDPTAPPGHSYRQIDYFLGQARRGTPEHFATAYAVLARTIGLPTRVVVGFSGGTPANGTVEYKSGDVTVWPEVKFDGIGWMRFNPLPESATKSKRNNAVAAGETQRKLEQAQKAAVSRQAGGGGGRSQNPQQQVKPVQKGSAPLPWWVYAAGAAVALVLLYVLAALLAPSVRRHRRRRADDPSRRIAGAWRQTLDHLADIGLAGSGTLTAHEVAGFGAGRLGEPARAHLGPLADLVNRARFAPPGDRAEADRDADRAWEHTDQVGRLVTAEAGRLRRLRRRLHPRSLRPR